MTINLTKSIPEFETERLYMRAITLKDCESYEKNFNDYEVIQYLSNLVPWPFPKGGVKDFLEKIVMPELGTKRWLWVIFLKDNKNEVIGCVDLWREGRPQHRGFWLAKKHWGKGLMTEAVKPVLNFAFTQLDFKSLTFANAVGNDRSKRIKEKTGATFLKTEPAKFVNPKYTKHELWKLKKEDWISFSEK